MNEDINELGKHLYSMFKKERWADEGSPSSLDFDRIWTCPKRGRGVGLSERASKQYLHEGTVGRLFATTRCEVVSIKYKYMHLGVQIPSEGHSSVPSLDRDARPRTCSADVCNLQPLLTCIQPQDCVVSQQNELQTAVQSNMAAHTSVVGCGSEKVGGHLIDDVGRVGSRQGADSSVHRAQE